MDTMAAFTLLDHTSVNNMEHSYFQWLETSMILRTRLKENRSLLEKYTLCMLRLAAFYQASVWAEEGEMALNRLRQAQGELCVLTNAFSHLRENSNAFLCVQEARLKTSEDWTAFRQLHRRLICLLGQTDTLERFQTLFFKTFLPIAPVNFYYRGFLENFMISLTAQEPSSSDTLLSKIWESV